MWQCSPLRGEGRPLYRYSNTTTDILCLPTKDVFVRLSHFGIFVRSAQRMAVTGMLA